MLGFRLLDALGRKNGLRINGEGEASVVVHPHPPKDEEETGLEWRQYFTADGLASGSNDMAVDGSSTSVEFYIKASQDYDRYIANVNMLIGDGGSPTLQQFGALTALTNGVEWFRESLDAGERTLHEGIKTNLEAVRTAGGKPAFGTGTDAFLADVSGGGTEKSYIADIDIVARFGKPYGIRLRKGTTERLVFRVNDNLAALSTFNIIAYGQEF